MSSLWTLIQLWASLVKDRLCLCWTCVCCAWFCACPVFCVPGASHGLIPRNSEDVKRAERRHAITLELGRPVQPGTRSNREKLLESLDALRSSQGIALDGVLQAAPRSPEQLVKILTDYGRDLFASGRPHSHCSETINAVGSKIPSVRRLPSGAWDHVRGWVRNPRSTIWHVRLSCFDFNCIDLGMAASCWPFGFLLERHHTNWRGHRRDQE